MASPAGVVIETERLRLLPTAENYAEAVFTAFTAAITTYMFPAPARNVDETRAFLRQARAATESGSDLQVVILHRQTGEFLGHGGLHHISGRTPELGIWIKQAGARQRVRPRSRERALGLGKGEPGLRLSGLSRRPAESTQPPHSGGPRRSRRR